MFYFARCMNIIFNSMLAQLVQESRIKNGLLSIAALMLDYNDIVVMCLQLITLRIVS